MLITKREDVTKHKVSVKYYVENSVLGDEVSY